MILNPLTRRVRYLDGLPVLPGHFPVLGHAPSMHFDAIGLLRWGRETLGPLFWMVNGPHHRSATYTERDAFDLLKNRTTSSEYLKENTKVLVGESLLGQDGKTHQHMRTAMNAPFTPRGLTVTGVGPVLAELFRAGIERWQPRQRLTILSETQDLALAAIFRILGIDVADLSIWAQQYREFVYAISPLPKWIPGSRTARAEQARGWLDRHFVDLIHKERAQPPRESFFSALVRGRDEEGKTLSDLELVDNLRLLTLAGHETTASVLAWVVITMAQRPELWDRVCEEARQGGAIPTSPQELRSFPLAEAVFRETLRVYPVVALTARQAIADVTIGHHTFPPGTMLNICLSLIMRDPELFPEPDRWNPDRWLGRKQAPTPLETAQFGGGPHFCLGYHLAVMESVQFIVALALRMSREGRRPRLADGPAPQHLFLPLGHPTRSAAIEFV